jgi:signal transduction histidine kinase
VARASTTAIRDFLPRGNTLDDQAFATRHRWVCWLLGLQIPALVLYGMVEGAGFEHALTAVWVPMACLLAGLHIRQRRVVAVVVTIGLVSCSTVLVHLADGATESYVHLFVMLGFIALYQDWIPFVGAVAFAVASTVAVPDGLFVDTPHDRPSMWLVAYVGAVLLACTGQMLFWRATEDEQRKSVRLARDLARAQVQIEARESVSELFVNLARRNQALLDRQITLLVAMEEREADPDRLAELFQLDHLATRIRRNAESLLVLSGEDPARRWGRPVPLAEVLRAAIAEVEDFRRADMTVDEGLAVAGRAVADMAHLLAELIENGLQFSPPESRVSVSSQTSADGACIVLVEDHGIGMSESDLAATNELLAHPPEVDLRLSKRLGFHVVARLAFRYRVRVRLSATPGGGVTVAVAMPEDLLAEAEAPSVVTVDPMAGDAASLPSPVAGPTVSSTPAAAPTLTLSPTPRATATGAAVAAPAAAPGPPTPPVPPAPAAPPRRAEPVTPVLPSIAGMLESAVPLTRRVPQASLDPRMRNGRTDVLARPTSSGTGGRSPEELRARLSQFQAAQAQARQETSALGVAGRGEDG